jgi:hypothetical protein
VGEILYIITTEILYPFGQTLLPSPIVSRLLGFYVLYAPFVLGLDVTLFLSNGIQLGLLMCSQITLKSCGLRDYPL